MAIAEYKKGDTDYCGFKVEHVINRTTDGTVYLREGGGLGYEFENLQYNMSEVMEKFDEIHTKISDELPKNLRERTISSLGSALFHAAHSQSLEEGLKCFESIEKRVEKIKTPNQAKSLLVLLNLIFTISAIIFCTLTFIYCSAPYNILFLCGGAGCFGSLFSLLQRNAKVSLNLTGGSGYTIMQALFITILGGMSGCLIYLISNSGIAFSFASDNVHSLSVLSVIAGFSERLVPELFAKVESGKKQI